MKTGNRPLPPRCVLGNVQPSGLDVESLKETGWSVHGILVVKPDDPRLGWIERKVIEDIGRKLYGRRQGNG